MLVVSFHPAISMTTDSGLAERAEAHSSAHLTLCPSPLGRQEKGSCLYIESLLLTGSSCLQVAARNIATLNHRTSVWGSVAI